MRVGLIFPGCHRKAGVERVIFECAQYLAARDHDTSVFANDWDGENLPGVKRETVPLSLRGSVPGLLGFHRQSTRAIRQTNPPFDILGTFGVQCPPGGVVWVQSVHRAWLSISQRERPLAQRLRQLCNPFHPVVLAMERSLFGGRKYRKLIALTAEVKQHLMDFYAVPEGDIAILPNGFSPTEFNVGNRQTFRADVRRQLGYGDGDRVVVFVANELERKGFGLLLRAIAALQNPDLRLLAVGRLNPGAYAGEIVRLGMTGRVHFTGPTNQAAKFYAAADVFALPTQYEAWGLVIIEALASGLPVLTSRLAGAAIAVEEPATGRLLDDPRDAEEIAAKLAPLIAGEHAAPEAISRSVQAYRWPEILRRYEAILADCVQS